MWRNVVHYALIHAIHTRISLSYVFYTSKSRATRMQIGDAYNLLYGVECALRYPLRKTKVHEFEQLVIRLLEAQIAICTPYSKSKCNSIKYHLPYHWGDTRVQLGCSPNEKSLEKKLAETQKRNFAFTNKKHDVEVPLEVECDVILYNAV